VIEDIIQYLEAIELGQKSPAHTITESIDLTSNDDYAFVDFTSHGDSSLVYDDTATLIPLKRRSHLLPSMHNSTQM
jgi:hypothetical protein